MAVKSIKKGRRFGSLRVVRRYGKDRWGRVLWQVKCDCGKSLLTLHYQLEGGFIKRCRPCSRPQHGLTKKYAAEYQSWQAMHSRCRDAENKWYGGAGIQVCDRWSGPGGFVQFVADMGRRPRNKTLDRKNPFGNYEPGNCRWADDETQNNNRRCNYTDEELAALREQARAQALEMNPTMTEVELEAAEVF